MTTTSHDTLLGQSLGKFRIDKLIGQGGMGAVYSATDTSLDRKVALKVIKPNLASGTEARDFLRRFEREAKAAARFKHPNAIEIYALDKTPQGLLYMALEFIQGRELIQVLRDQGPLQPPQAVHVLGQVLAGLEAAHRVKIVHRDLKPHNIMIEDGPDMRAKILDFGIAKVRDSSEQAITMAGQVMGTAYYMAPEQAMGREVDHRTDLYSVGVILYQVLTGRLPFKHKEFMKVLDMHVNSPPPPLDVPGLEAFEPVIRRAMAKNPQDRFQSATEFSSHLYSALQSGSPTHPPTGSGSSAGALTVPQSGSHHGHLPTGAALSPVPGSGTGHFSDTSPMQGWQAGGTNQFFAALLGRTIGKYVVEEQLGEGGMGAVFRARDRLLGRPVALKVVHPSLAHRQDVRERFLREARATLEFSHPNAIATRGCDETPDGLLYMTLDYCPGETLRALLRREERLSIPRALGVARQALLAVAEAHGKGIVHRDLKPENMMVEQDERGEDRVRVCDFGLAKLLDVSLEEGGESLTQAGQSLGTPHYMAPEQVEGGPIDGRADIYSMGCVLYELLTGTKPFHADTVRSIVFMHMGVAPEPLRKRAPHAKITPEIEALVLKALEKEPERRFASADAFLAAIDGLGIDLPGTRPSTSRHGRTATGRHAGPDTATIPPGALQGPSGPPAAVMVLGAIVALAIVGAVVVFGYRLTQRQQTQIQIAKTEVGKTDASKTTVYEATKTDATKTDATKTVAKTKTISKTEPVKKTDDVDPDADRKERERLQKIADQKEADRKERERLKKIADQEEADRKERERIRKITDRKERERLQKIADRKRKERERLQKIADQKEADRKERERLKKIADQKEADRKERERLKKIADQKEADRKERERLREVARREKAKANRLAEERLQRGYVRADGLLVAGRAGQQVLFERFLGKRHKWISREVTIGAFAAYADQLPPAGRRKAEWFLRSTARVLSPGSGSFLSRIPAHLRSEPIRAVPLAMARGFAAWLKCRLPSRAECLKLPTQWPEANSYWTFAGEVLTIRKGKLYAVKQGQAALKPGIRLIGPPRP